MYLNPIVKKDVKVQARSMKICWSVFAYELILALVFFLAINVIQSASRYSTGNIYSAMVWLYPILAVTQLIILGLVVPVRTASSISGEKERQTFDIMMNQHVSLFDHSGKGDDSRGAGDVFCGGQYARHGFVLYNRRYVLGVSVLVFGDSAVGVLLFSQYRHPLFFPVQEKHQCSNYVLCFLPSVLSGDCPAHDVV